MAVSCYCVRLNCYVYNHQSGAGYHVEMLAWCAITENSNCFSYMRETNNLDYVICLITEGVWIPFILVAVLCAIVECDYSLEHWSKLLYKQHDLIYINHVFF